MKYSLFALLFIILISNHTSAQVLSQSDPGRFGISISANSWLITGSLAINGQVRINNSEGHHLYLRGGLLRGSIVELFCANNDNFTGKHIGINYIKTAGRHHFELNGGLYFLSDKDVPDANGGLSICNPQNRNNILPLIEVAWRYQKPGENVFFSIKAGTFGAGVETGFAF